MNHSFALPTFEQTVVGVYARNSRFVISPERTRVGVEGDLSPELELAVKKYRIQLLEMLAGPALSGSGWRARKALMYSAYHWLDKKLIELGIDATPEVDPVYDLLAREMWRLDKLNWACAHESFDKFRDALKEHIACVLSAIKSPSEAKESTLAVSSGGRG